MEEIKQTWTYTKMSVAELDEADVALREAALEAAHKAYAPYSHFQVGAALRLSNGQIITGNNQENIAYPSGLCAERTAMFYAGAHYPQEAICSLAIIAFAQGKIQPQIAPCGACRQVMVESEQRSGQPMRILLCGEESVYVIHSAQFLLPFTFTF